MVHRPDGLGGYEDRTILQLNKTNPESTITPIVTHPHYWAEIEADMYFATFTAPDYDFRIEQANNRPGGLRWVEVEGLLHVWL